MCSLTWSVWLFSEEIRVKECKKRKPNIFWADTHTHTNYVIICQTNENATIIIINITKTITTQNANSDFRTRIYTERERETETQRYSQTRAGFTGTDLYHDTVKHVFKRGNEIMYWYSVGKLMSFPLCLPNRPSFNWFVYIDLINMYSVVPFWFSFFNQFSLSRSLSQSHYYTLYTLYKIIVSSTSIN